MRSHFISQKLMYGLPIFYDCSMNADVYFIIFTAYVKHLIDKSLTTGKMHA
jgi:hypothetical protein